MSTLQSDLKEIKKEIKGEWPESGLFDGNDVYLDGVCNGLTRAIKVLNKYVRRAKRN